MAYWKGRGAMNYTGGSSKQRPETQDELWGGNWRLRSSGAPGTEETWVRNIHACKQSSLCGLRCIWGSPSCRWCSVSISFLGSLPRYLTFPLKWISPPLYNPHPSFPLEHTVFTAPASRFTASTPIDACPFLLATSDHWHLSLPTAAAGFFTQGESTLCFGMV